MMMIAANQLLYSGCSIKRRAIYKIQIYLLNQHKKVCVIKVLEQL